MKINRNILWTEIFINELANLGVRYACISPGSRSTPLTYAIAKNKRLKPYIIIDERSSAFFATGLARGTNSPVILVCTSGTAVAEFYPAIIEAYYQRIPLIICTADRPIEALDNGTNQTINQNNIYKNHIRFFSDVGLPELSEKRINHLKSIANRAFYDSKIKSPGPVHLNFPFRKPLEPSSYTDEIVRDLDHIRDEKYLEKIYSTQRSLSTKNDNLKLYNESLVDKSRCSKFSPDPKILEYIISLIKVDYAKVSSTKNEAKGLIIVGSGFFDNEFLEATTLLSNQLNFPILAEATSQLRINNQSNDNIISNYDAFLRSNEFSNSHQVEIILYFGKSVISQGLENYLENSKAKKFIINNYGDLYDPSNNAELVIQSEPLSFCKLLLEEINKKKLISKNNVWINDFKSADNISEEIKNKIINKTNSFYEPTIINQLIELIPENSNIMISNSLPIRDFEYFSSSINKKINIFHNRGASGIDGITSTALGIATESDNPTILLTGDLAFYYDLNSLLIAKKYLIPLIIIIINNNGGAIFEILPIAKEKNIMKEYFITPHNLNFKTFVKGFSGSYKKIKTREEFINSFKSALRKKTFSVLDIETNSQQSIKIREKYCNEVQNKLKKHF